MKPMSETTKAVIKLVAGFVVVVCSAAASAILGAGQDSFAVFKERPSVWLAIAVAGATFVMNSLSKGPQEARSIDAERTAAVERKVIQNLVDAGRG